MLGSRGISMEGDVLDMATAIRVINKSGSWFTYGDAKLGQGREKARAYLEENPQVLEEVKQKVLAAKDQLKGASDGGGDSSE